MCFQFPCLAGRRLGLAPGYGTISGTEALFALLIKHVDTNPATLPKAYSFEYVLPENVRHLLAEWQTV